jgi:hypothetical protein
MENTGNVVIPEAEINEQLKSKTAAITDINFDT